MANFDTSRVLEGYEITESPGFTANMKKLEHRNRGVAMDIDRFLCRVIREGLVQKSLTLRDLHIARLIHNPSFLEAKRVHCPSLHRGAREGLRLVFSIDPEKMRIFLVDVFAKNDLEIWMPSALNSGNRKHTSVARKPWQ